VDDVELKGLQSQGEEVFQAIGVPGWKSRLSQHKRGFSVLNACGVVWWGGRQHGAGMPGVPRIALKSGQQLRDGTVKIGERGSKKNLKQKEKAMGAAREEPKAEEISKTWDAKRLSVQENSFRKEDMG